MRFLVPALLLLSTPAALAQLDLPAKKTGDTARAADSISKGKQKGHSPSEPHLTCTVCGNANYDVPIQWNAPGGLQQAYCKVCHAPRTHYLPRDKGTGKSRRGGGLDLPKDGRGLRSPAEAGGGQGARAEEQGAASVAAARRDERLRADSDPALGDLTRSSQEILETLARLRDVNDPVALQAGETLLSLGDAGRVAARVALGSDHAPTMLTGVRVLLRSGVPEDAEVVVQRLQRRMPNRAAGPALSELIDLDPVRATPKLLCQLLDHPQQPVRAVASRRLAELDTDDLVPYLGLALHSQRGDTRLRAINLLALRESPEVRDQLLTCLADPQAKVAARVIEALARFDDPALDDILLARAFGDRWLLRPSAYALLALIAREDRLLEPKLGEGHVEALLTGLDSHEPFIAGTCAAALAGIGFRSDRPEVSEWLDSEVAGKLVAVVAGLEFFNDYPALREPALRRLKMITGQSFGTDGPAWAEWWLSAKDSFVASRAVLPAKEGDERRLQVAFRDRSSGEAFVLVGPDLARRPPADRGEVFYLDAASARDLLDFLSAQGLLGIERLPGTRGGLPDKGRLLDVRIGERSKNFIVGPSQHLAWFDQSVGRAQALAERCHWQRFPDPKIHGSRLELFLAEGPWWFGDHDAAARNARLKQLIFARAHDIPTRERDPEVAALEEIEQDGGGLGQGDFHPLLELLKEEPWLGGRAEKLARLARVAAGLKPGADTSEPELAARLWELIDTLHDRFSAEAMPLLAGLIADAGPPVARVAATDSRPILRAVSAHALSLSASEEDLAALRTLLEDRVIDVKVAAIDAIGSAKLASLREIVLERARAGEVEERAAALRAVGRLGGEGVRDVLTTALTEDDVRLRLAAARGIAALHDPDTVPLLVSLLRQRTTPGMVRVVREALLDQGEAAHDELFAAMRSPSRELRREASLLLARQGVAAAAPVMMELLSGDQTDGEVARELAILTCIDMRGEIDPAESWFQWLDTVRRGDSLAWLRAAAEARSIPAPSAEAFEEKGNRDVIGFLIQMMRVPEDYVAERARRELSHYVGRELKELPPHGTLRDRWLSTLLESLEGEH